MPELETVPSPLNITILCLVKELENERDTVGEDEMLRHKFELVHMIDFEVFE